MSEDVIIRCCAPTLAAIKTGTIFNASFTGRQDMLDTLRSLNRRLSGKGIAAIPLNYRDGKALIYLYRPRLLERDLRDGEAQKLLKKCGYTGLEPAGMLMKLKRALEEESGFPHEIGLFLGYPPEDVKGFMEHKPCKYTGMWKVYDSDVDSAKQMLRKCRNCTTAYLKRYHEGWSLSRLTVQPVKSKA